MALRIVLGAAVALLVLAYAVGSGLLVGTNSGWYLALEQPPWQPPPWVFGLIWPYNFIVLLIAGIVLATQAPLRTALPFVVVLAASVLLALGWAYLFYGPHALGWATAALACAAALTVILVVLAWRWSPWLGAILLPYQCWLIVATSLSWAYASQAR